MKHPLFKDRFDAGKQLAKQLQKYKDAKEVIVIGMARGGVVTAASIAHTLHLPLDVIVVRKIGAPHHEELAIGAIAEKQQSLILNEALIETLQVSSQYLKKEISRQKQILKTRLALYRNRRKALDLFGKVVILVDDGIATGASVRVAILALKESQVKKIVLAVPVAPSDTLKKLSYEVDETVCLLSAASFEGVGSFYFDFKQTSDEEIIRLLSE